MKTTPEFIAALDEPVDRKQVKTLSVRGQKLDYLPGFYVRAQLNRHFEHAWSWSCSVEMVAERPTRDDKVQVVYRATGTLSATLPSGAVVTRQGIGAAQGQGSWADAHELAIKAAETDALKRAASTFGPQFGLSLYDPSDRFGWEHAVANDEPAPTRPSAPPATASLPRKPNWDKLNVVAGVVATATTLAVGEVKSRIKAAFGAMFPTLTAEEVDALAEDLEIVAAHADPVAEFGRYLARITAASGRQG